MPLKRRNLSAASRSSRAAGIDSETFKILGDMKIIQISDEDFKFLEDLQHELNTQTNDGNADPVYWGVMETREVGVPEGCGDERVYLGDGGMETLNGAVAYIGEYLVEDEDIEAWNEVNKTDIDEVITFCREKLGMPEVRIVDVEKKSEISRQTGAFLTKRACQQYIDCYGYNHSNPHTYAMTAYRNFELEHLLKILKTIKLQDIQCVDISANSKKYGIIENTEE